MYSRILPLFLPPHQSCFLWGARKTGKSTFLRTHFPDSLFIDLLDTDLFFRYIRRPSLFREEILAHPNTLLERPIIVDEIQKIPALLDEVHLLIERHKLSFVLCGSSARKLKRTGINLLGGRAWRYHFFPLVFPEISDFDLLKILQRGTIPSHYTSPSPHQSLRSYVQDYLKQEIQEEGLVRNLPAFSQFLESVGFSNGEIINYTNIARDCGVDAKTIKEYYAILCDTLVGYILMPYAKASRSQLITASPKFYMFDVGVAGMLSERVVANLKGQEAGRALENYVFQEIYAYNIYKERHKKLSYWRTKNGHEVDFIVGDGEVAIETKITSELRPDDLKGLHAFWEHYNMQKLYVVCQEPVPRKTNYKGCDILVLPVYSFLDSLWKSEIF